MHSKFRCASGIKVGSRQPMSNKQIEAYLVSRDALRRIQRISSLFPLPAGQEWRVRRQGSDS